MTEQQGSLEGDAPWGGAEWGQWRDEVSRAVHEHGAALEEILAVLEDEGPGGPLHWETMTPKRRALVMEQLADFVRFLDRTYMQWLAEYSMFKPCWWRHPDVVWPLTALWAAFRVTYAPKARPSKEQAMWHEQLLWPTLERLRRSSMKDCNSKEHRPNIQAALVHSPELADQLTRWSNDEDIRLGDYRSSDDSADGVQPGDTTAGADPVTVSDNGWAELSGTKPGDGVAHDSDSSSPWNV